MSTEKHTIVLIHGLWVTPRSWEPFRDYYAQRGHSVLAPPWPRIDGEVEDVRRDPSALNGLGVTEIVDHYDQLIRRLDRPPIIMGHSFGGLCVQMLLDRGLGAAGVVIDSAAPKGVLRLPLSQIRALSPVLLNPANRKRTVALTLEQFRYGFANVMSDDEVRDAYERYAIPTPGRPVFQAGLASLNPKAATKVNYRNDTRAPLLLISGAEDHTVPTSVIKSNYRKYRRSRAVTALRVFPGRSHLILLQAGWQEVAEHALAWSESEIRQRLVAADAIPKKAA
jgi:alpha-beta hydrolase superfamily lysophospholipase